MDGQKLVSRSKSDRLHFLRRLSRSHPLNESWRPKRSDKNWTWSSRKNNNKKAKELKSEIKTKSKKKMIASKKNCKRSKSRRQQLRPKRPRLWSSQKKPSLLKKIMSELQNQSWCKSNGERRTRRRCTKEWETDSSSCSSCASTSSEWTPWLNTTNRKIFRKRKTNRNREESSESGRRNKTKSRLLCLPK